MIAVDAIERADQLVLHGATADRHSADRGRRGRGRQRARNRHAVLIWLLVVAIAASPSVLRRVLSTSAS